MSRGRGELIDHIFPTHRLVDPTTLPTVRTVAAHTLPSMTDIPTATNPSDHAALVATVTL